jgi:hypothetical protein
MARLNIAKRTAAENPAVGERQPSVVENLQGAIGGEWIARCVRHARADDRAHW